MVIPAASLAATAPRAVPDCAVSLPQGQTNLHQFAGKVVYVDFWASWCVSCLASFPFMEQLQRELGPQGLQIVAVNMDENAADARRFLSTHKPSFPIALGNNSQCAKQFGVNAMPSTFFVDRNGNIRGVHAGFHPGEAATIRATIQNLLKEPRHS
jgi:thiol-disulfide isomerase/thioredoxin